MTECPSTKVVSGVSETVGMRRRDEQGAATREVLMATAERLFAERGVHAVSNRQISEAAGQGNNTAVSYHFGGKADLVRAILDKHSAAIEQIRGRLVLAVSDPDDLREWVGVAVRSVTEHLAELGHPSWYARFLAQVAADPALHNLDEGEALDASPALRALRDGMNRALPSLSEEVRAARSALTRHLIYQATIDHERALADGAPHGEASWDDVAEEITDAVVAVWRAPVAGDSRQSSVAADGDRGAGGEQPAIPGSTDELLPDPEMVAFARSLRPELAKALMEYRFAVDEMLTKVTILREEFLYMHHYNPIEHVTSRIKSPASILDKAVRKGAGPTVASIRERVTDIAGIRITCSFIADTYRVLDALTSQDDVRVIETKDFIADPKPSGYQSLHALCEIPVFLSTGPVPVTVEIQIRTVAMDFWASLEHKIFYKYDGAVPEHVVADLGAAAAAAEQLDRRMEQLYAEVHGPAELPDHGSPLQVEDELLARFWRAAVASPPPGSPS